MRHILHILGQLIHPVVNPSEGIRRRAPIKAAARNPDLYRQGFSIIADAFPEIPASACKVHCASPIDSYTFPKHSFIRAP